MLMTYLCRVAAGAIISAALTAGSLGLTATAATSTAVNCPPTSISDPGNGGC